VAVIAQLDVNLAANTAEFDTKLEKAERTATNFNKSLERQITTFGMSSREARIYGLAQRGVSEETIAVARALDRQLTQLEQAAAKQAQLKAEATQLAGAFGSTGRNAAALASGMGPLAIAAVAVGAGMMAAKKGIDFVVEGVSRQIGEIDRLNDLAQKLDVSFASLAGLGVAAKLNGSDLEGVARAASKLEQNLGNASKGTVNALDKIGLSVNELKAMPVDQAIGKIADGLKGLETPADRAAVVTALFGKAGADLIPLLEGGSEAILSAAQKAERYGLALSEIDAAQVAASADAWDEVGMAMDGAFSQLAVEVAPALHAIGIFLTEAIVAGKDLGQALGNSFETVDRYLSAMFPKLSALWKLLEATGALQPFKDVMDEANNRVERSMKALEEKKSKKIGADDDQVIERVRKAQKADLSHSEAQRIADSVATAEEKLAKRRMELAVASGIGAISMETYSRALKKAEDEYAKSKQGKMEKIDPRSAKEISPGLGDKFEEERERRFSGGLLRGSAEALSLINTGKRDPAAETAKSAKELVTEAKKQNQLLNDLNRNLPQAGVDTVEIA